MDVDVKVKVRWETACVRSFPMQLDLAIARRSRDWSRKG